MRMKIAALCLGLACLSGGPGAVAAGPSCTHPQGATNHTDPGRHDFSSCGFKLQSQVKLSQAGGLGSIAIHKGMSAVLRRDEGIVDILDIRPRKPRLLGSFDDGASDSLDGDVVFSHDGRYVFYARQTVTFSGDGIHVLDVSDPSAPTEVFYKVGGGSLRIAYHHDGGDDEWVIVADAIEGLVVSRFERTTGALVPVWIDPLPALHVGGPASAGLHVVPGGPGDRPPLLYATSGRTGLRVFDLSQPELPTLLGSWNEEGLADLVVETKRNRTTVFAAAEYWFSAARKPAVFELDATDPSAIKSRRSLSYSERPEEPWRAQGLALSPRYLYAAWSHGGLVAFDRRYGKVAGFTGATGPAAPEARVQGTPFAMDVASRGGLLYLTDASSGVLSVLKHRPGR